MSTEWSGADAWQRIKDSASSDADLVRYLQLAFEPFHSSGEWADIEKLQRRLLRDGDSIDIYAIGDRIPSELGINPIRVDNRCQLTAAGISVCKGSDNEIRDFLATVQLAARKYLADEQPDPTQAGLSSDELRDSLGLDELAIRRVFRMIEWEPFIAGGEGAADGTWRRNIATSMRHFIRVATFDEYMATKLSLLRPRWTPTVPALDFPRPTFPFQNRSGVVSVATDEDSPVEESGSAATKRDDAPDKHKVFVVHGRNTAARDGIFAFLRALGLRPIEWSQAIAMTGEGSPYVGRVLDVAFSAAQAVVVLFTPDEVAYLRPEYADRQDDPQTVPAPQARPNVLFEAGMAIGRDPRRTILVELGDVRPFSDIAGRHAVRLDGTPKTRLDLAIRLETAGCEVDRSGSDWMTAGELHPPDTRRSSDDRSHLSAGQDTPTEVPLVLTRPDDQPPPNPRLKGVVRPTFNEGYLVGVMIEAFDEQDVPVKAAYRYVVTMNGRSSPPQESCCTPLSIGMGGIARGAKWAVSGWVRLKDDVAPLSGNGVAP